MSKNQHHNGIQCGTQCLNCYFPLHMDTYKGCSHACKYCYVENRYTIQNIYPLNNAGHLKRFIEGHRILETAAFDWDIPVHWGANSDPFQECEKEYKKSLELLKIFAETKYPFIISTKNPVLLTESPYLETISECNCLLQISMACPKYDTLETGAPSFDERIKAAGILSKHVRRVMARIQPCFPDCVDDIIKELPRYKEAGIYGVTAAGYVTMKKTKGMTKTGGRYYRFPLDVLSWRFKKLKQACHENDLKFFCSEDGLDHLGDNLVCCGTMGMDDFKPNLFTLSHMAYDPDNSEPANAMKKVGSAVPFKALGMRKEWHDEVMSKSYADNLYDYYDYVYWLREQRDKYGE